MTRTVLPLTLCLALVGCGLVNQEGPKLNQAGSEDADTDTDADVDADTDADTDVDTAPPIDTATETVTVYLDGDGDGYGGSTTFEADEDNVPSGYVVNDSDCDDSDSAVNPGATEVCDEVDNNCDGEVDEAVTATFYEDADGDGQGSESSTTEACSVPDGYVDNTDDCDDGNAAAYLGATELCDGFDTDCDGLSDEPDAEDASNWYADADGDGYGNLGVGQVACDQPLDFVVDASDCDDTDAAINPAASEVCDGVTDENCDGTVDESTAIDASIWYADIDGDGFGDAGSSTVSCTEPSGYVADATDCDDSNGSVNPVGTETCNGLDDDCDGATDPSISVDAATWYADDDGDGYGDSNSSTVSCTVPSGYVADATDCDDVQSLVNPAGTEVCDGIDEDCDGEVDEGVMTTYYADADADGQGNESDSIESCSASVGYVAEATDCDDADAAVYLGATEVCNEIDDNCDGSTDEGVTSTYYADLDGDGFGDAGSSTVSCTEPSGYVADATDCDDADHSVYPGATEYVNGVDDNCDGDADEGTSFDDLDGDGYSLDAGDCDDANADVFPGAEETCDGVDNDCDDGADEDDAVDASSWYPDGDGDGYGDSAVSIVQCDEPSGFVDNDSDCDDSDAAYNPGADESDCSDPEDYNCDGSAEYADLDLDGYAACEDCNDSDNAVNPDGTEVCDGVDNDCDGEVDEDDAMDASTWYADTDADGYGDASSSDVECEEPSGYVVDDTDCDDLDHSVHPGATEFCNGGTDDDCDASTVEECPSADTGGDTGISDTGSFDTGTAPVDTGSAPIDTGTAPTDTGDTGVVPADTGTSIVDTGSVPADTGTPPVDTGSILVDTGSAVIDTGTAIIDTGTPPTDTAVNVFTDADGDGYFVEVDDCDDTLYLVNPGASEVCGNGVDDDCDGAVDETTCYSALVCSDDGTALTQVYSGDLGSAISTCEDGSTMTLDDGDSFAVMDWLTVTSTASQIYDATVSSYSFSITAGVSDDDKGFTAFFTDSTSGAVCYLNAIVVSVTGDCELYESTWVDATTGSTEHAYAFRSTVP